MFKKGDPKPAGSGIKKGQKQKKTVWLNESLSQVGFSWNSELKAAYEEKDYKKIELLQQLIPYLNPKIKEKEVSEETDNNPESSEIDTENLIQLLKK
jgi:hypothetical protein